MFDLGKVLKSLRVQHGYTQSDVGDKLDVSTGSVGRWENNASIPSTEKFIEIAILYNIPINYLVGIPLEETLSINGLTPDQRHILQAIVADFRRDKGVTAGKYTLEQQQLINALFNEFNK